MRRAVGTSRWFRIVGGAVAIAVSAWLVSSAGASLDDQPEEPNTDGSVCGKGAIYCTVDGALKGSYVLGGDSDCEWRIDIDYGDGTSETGRLTNGGDYPGFPFEHAYPKPGSYEFTVRLSQGSSPGGFPPGCGNYRETCTVQYPKAPKKGETMEFLGLAFKDSLNSRKKTFVMSHGSTGPGLVQITAPKSTEFRGKVKGFGDLPKYTIEVRARFDGKRWVAERIKDDRLHDLDRECQVGL